MTCRLSASPDNSDFGAPARHRCDRQRQPFGIMFGVQWRGGPVRCGGVLCER